EQRQPEVKHNGVVGFGVALEVGIAAVVGLVDRVAGLLQAGANLRAQGRIVFDEQQSHGVAGGAGKAYGRVRSSRRSTWAVAASSSSLSNLPSGCNSLISYTQRSRSCSSSTSSTCPGWSRSMRSSS